MKEKLISLNNRNYKTKYKALSRGSLRGATDFDDPKSCPKLTIPKQSKHRHKSFKKTIDSYINKLRFVQFVKSVVKY